MIRVSSKILARFCVQNKTQNFFELTPIYPDNGDKDFDIYNSERKRINILDSYSKVELKKKDLRNFVKNRIYLKKYDKFKKYSNDRLTKVDKDTSLAIGLDSDFDAFLDKVKKQAEKGKNSQSKYKDMMFNLIRRFKCKSQPELFRLFRISIANKKHKSLIYKIRGSIISDAVEAAGRLKSYSKLEFKDINEANKFEGEFQSFLLEIDKKIEKAEDALRFSENGLPKKLSDYDPVYGWKEEWKDEIREGYDFNTLEGPFQKIKTSSVTTRSNLQNESIRVRINRFYFLRRLQLLKKEESEYLSFHEELPMNITERQSIMNELANRYKEVELLQQPDLEDIYREIDIVIDKVFIKVSSGESSQIDKSEDRKVYDKAYEKSDYLWDNMNVEEIACQTMYSQDAFKEITLTDELLGSLSPSSHTELSLNRLPINLYRHSELEVFGIFNEHHRKLGRNLMNVEEFDFQPVFNDFTLEVANKRYKRIQSSVKQGKYSSYGKAKRKTAMAEVFLTKGTGKVTINNKPIQDYFGDTFFRVETLKPFVFTDTSGLYDAVFNVVGSGLHGQSQCMAYALARALIKINPDHKSILWKFGLVGFDFRQKEAKKVNLYSARVRPPYVRR